MGMWKSKKRYKYLHKGYFVMDGYFACSVGNVSEEMLRKYIENHG